MKKLTVLLLALTISAPMAFGALTQQEENFVSNLFAKKATLQNLVDGITNETVPRDIALLKKDIDTLIAARDSEITAVKVTASNDIRTIEQNYEVLIDAKESAISSLRSSL